MNPLFSIILTTYNRRQLLPRAIRSVLQQTCDDFELIVVDDHSTDDTPQLFSGFLDSKITYIQHTHNQGVSTARNTGIQKARGTYLCFLDDDDELLAEYLQELYSFLTEKKQPFVGLIWPGIAEIKRSSTSSSSGVTSKTRLFKINRKKNLSFLTEVLFSGVSIHRTCFERVGVFNPQLKLREDADMMFRMVAAGLDCASIPKVLINIYHHEYSSLSRSIGRAARIANTEYFLVTHGQFLNQHLSLWLGGYTSLVGDYYHIGKHQEARELVKRICKKKWFSPKIWELFLRFELRSLKSILAR